MANDIDNAKPLHDVLQVTMGMLVLQTRGEEIAIPYWRGAPGIGKTSLITISCKNSDMNLIETHYGQTPIEEVSGLPTFYNFKIDDKDHKGTQWTLPDILTQLYEISSNGKTTVWLLDDFHLAPPAMMALGYEMFTERKLRGFKIPNNVAFILAGNMSAKAGSKRNLFSAVANRCAIMPVKVDFDYWKTNFAIPNGINSKIISFLNNNKYRKYFQEEEQLDEAWSSARSWTKFSNMLNPLEEANKKDGISQTDLLYYCAAHCGNAAASEFTSYYKIFSLVETDKIFDKLIPIKIPESLTDRYIYMLANVSEFIDRYTKGKNSEDKLESCNIMGKIIIETANESEEIALTGMKEILVIQKSLNLRSLYDQLKNTMTMRDSHITERLVEDLFNYIKS